MSRSESPTAGGLLGLPERASARGRSTVGIFRLDDRGHWHLEGGGVCVRMERHAIAFSAGHLLHAGGGTLWLGAAGAKVPVRGALTKGQEPYAPPEVRRLDMGFVPLLWDDLRRMPALELLSPEAVDLEDDPPTDDYVAIAPNKPSGLDGRVMAARAAPGDAYPACGVDIASHLLVDIPGSVDAAGVLGSGVWRQAPGPAGDLFSGLVVDVRPLAGAGGLRLVATRAGILIYCVLGVLGIDPRRGKARRTAKVCTAGTQ